MYVDEFGDLGELEIVGRRPTKFIRDARKRLSRAIVMMQKLRLPKELQEEAISLRRKIIDFMSKVMRHEREAIIRRKRLPKKLVVAAEMKCKPGVVTPVVRKPIAWMRRR